MAIICEFNSAYGISVTEAYVKISRFDGNRDVVNFDVLVYASEVARNSSKPFIEILNYSIPYQDGMSISSLYEYLKSDVRFINAMDA